MNIKAKNLGYIKIHVVCSGVLHCRGGQLFEILGVNIQVNWAIMSEWAECLGLYNTGAAAADTTVWTPHYTPTQ